MGAFFTVAHAGVTAALHRAVVRPGPPHALLVVGPAHVGKTTLALDLAAGLSCVAPDPADRPCRACIACRKVASGNHPDLHRLRPEGAGEQIRLGPVQGLISALALLPMEGRHRVAIIEGAHRLNPDAQNALLKTLEEPPDATCLILAADDEAALLPTVRSRCAMVRMGPLPGADVARLLTRSGLADAARALQLARLARGRPGLAVAFAHEPESTIINARLARSLLDLLEADRAVRLGRAAELLADGTALERAAERGAVAAERGDGAGGPAVVATTGGRERGSRLRRGDAPTAPDASPDGLDAGGDGAGITSDGARRAASPQERRRATMRVLASWRDVARDLAFVKTAGAPHVAHSELLDELVAAAPRVPLPQLVAFAARLEGLSSAIEAYANPELALDVLLLAWPYVAPADAA